MNASLQFDTREFHEAVKQTLLKTNRELSKAINSRMFFLLVRFFTILPPQYPAQKRREVREYLNFKIGDVNRFDKKTGKRIGKRRLKDVFSRVHKIVQAKRGAAGEKGLYGQDMRDAAEKFRRRAINSVGYLKSAVLQAIVLVNGRFVQAGTMQRTNKKTGKVRKATFQNAALRNMQAFYGINGGAAGSVGRHKGSWATGKPAKPGFNPSAWVTINAAVKDDQFSNVTQIMNSHFQRAMNDERAEMIRHLTETAQAVADEHNAK